MIKYFCDICEDEVDKENPLNELTITMNSINITNSPSFSELLTIKQICTNCITEIKSVNKYVKLLCMGCNPKDGKIVYLTLSEYRRQVDDIGANNWVCSECGLMKCMLDIEYSIRLLGN